MTLVRLGDNWGDPQYALELKGAFDLTTPIQGMHLEAGARGKCVIVQVTLVDPEIYFNQSTEQEGDNQDDETGKPD